MREWGACASGWDHEMIALRDAFAPGSFPGFIGDYFSETGRLSHSRDFEYRAEQQQMAEAVARGLESSDPLVVEAGTGVGKSLAYLIPAAFFALRNKRKAIITTHTINLQEQLAAKDIPLVKKLLGEDDELKAVLLKGRQNYLCPTRLEGAMETSGDLFSTSEVEEMRALWEWASVTEDGTLSDLDFHPSPKVWAQVCSEAHACTAKRCGPTGRCFYQELRKQAADANLLVMNHTLFFTLLGQNAIPGDDADVGAAASEDEEPGFLYPGDFVVFDEAHTLENIAARQLGLRVAQSSVRFDAQRLYNPRTRKGLFAMARSAEGIKAVAGLLDAMEMFFAEVEGRCTFRGPAREYRVHDIGLVEDTISGALLEVEKVAKSASEDARSEAAAAELNEMARRMRSARAGVQAFLDQGLDEHVYWVERTGGGDRGVPSIVLHAAPVDVSEVLERILFREGRECILTSATLGVGDANLNYFRQRVGAMRARALQIGSPFDYESQMKLYIAKEMPMPNDKLYAEALHRWIAYFLEKSDGRAFVLFTSYRQMADAADALGGFLEENNWTLLQQGKGKPRHRLIAEFREDTHSVLFGTDSFWTGVDVPGEALSNVIVTRLPFAVPDHPLTAARLEQIDENGGNPFMEYSVPEAVLKLRQGIGRLIRSSRDEGIAVILDNRVLTKRYGQAFVKALPVRPEIVEGQGLDYSGMGPLDEIDPPARR